MRQWDLRLADAGAASSVSIAGPELDPAVPSDLLEQTPGIVWTTDLELGFTSATGGGLEELKLGRNQIVGLTLFELFNADEDGSEVVSAHLLALTGETASFEVTIADRSFQGRVGPLHDGNDERIGTICALLEVGDAAHAVEVRSSDGLVTVR
jgi:hypothetical protein